MAGTEPSRWSNRSPGDLDRSLPEVSRGDAAGTVRQAGSVLADWAKLGLSERCDYLRRAQAVIRDRAEELARLISEETGKPIREANGELAAVVAKFDLTLADAERFVADEPQSEGPHAAVVRHRPLGVAAVIAPFNFPLHLGHGAAVAYLAAGNPVVFKPSPLAAHVCRVYGEIMASELPEGVFQILQGGGEVGRSLAMHPEVRAVCFTGSVAAGKQLALALAEDISKSLALELGGKNAVMVFADADLNLAAQSIAEALCLTAGQRCNATSRVLVEQSALDEFLEALTAALKPWQPGNPLDPRTQLGPLVSAAAVERYQRLGSDWNANWVIPAERIEQVDGRRGHYVRPAVGVFREESHYLKSALSQEEAFSPVLAVQAFHDVPDAVRQHNHTPYGLTASVFTRDEGIFQDLDDRLRVGNLYWNLPTTLSPSTLPFGGWGCSGNGKPGGRGFIRFCTQEQAVQWRQP